MALVIGSVAGLAREVSWAVQDACKILRATVEPALWILLVESWLGCLRVGLAANLTVMYMYRMLHSAYQAAVRTAEEQARLWFTAAPQMTLVQRCSQGVLLSAGGAAIMLWFVLPLFGARMATLGLVVIGKTAIEWSLNMLERVVMNMPPSMKT